MTRLALAFAAALWMGCSAVSSAVAGAADGDQIGKHLNPCAVPNEIGDSIAETAWQIWVAATCPVNDNQYPFVVCENWIEQSQLYPNDPSEGPQGAQRGCDDSNTSIA